MQHRMQRPHNPVGLTHQHEIGICDHASANHIRGPGGPIDIWCPDANVMMLSKAVRAAYRQCSPVFAIGIRLNLEHYFIRPYQIQRSPKFTSEIRGLRHLHPIARSGFDSPCCI